MREIDLYNIGDSQEDAQEALRALRADFDAHTHDGVNSKSFDTLRSEMSSSRVFSIKKLSYTDNTAGFWAGLVGATVKLFLGNATNFLKWDGTNLSLSNFNLIRQYTAGENITAGRLVGFKHKVCSWGDDAQADRNTTALISGMTYVDEDNPNTTHGDATSIARPKLGITSLNSHYYIYGKIDLSSNPPGLPAWNEVQQVLLRMYIITTATSAQNFSVVPVAAAFDEATITWNNKPANVSSVAVASARVATAIQSESMASAANLTQTGYVEFDITDMYRLWSQGTITNNGFSITTDGGAGAGSSDLGGRTRTGGGDYNQGPYLVIIPINDNPGSGNTITVNDGKMYHMSDGSETNASDRRYNNIKQIVGIAGSTVSSGGTVDVYLLTQKSIIPSSVISATPGRAFYLQGTAGQIDVLTNDVQATIQRWQPRIGYGLSDNSLMIDYDPGLRFIQNSTIASAGILPPITARKGIVNITGDYGSGSFNTTIEVSKDWHNTQTNKFIDLSASTKFISIVVTWATGTAGKITVARTDDLGGTAFSAGVDWFA